MLVEQVQQPGVQVEELAGSQCCCHLDGEWQWADLQEAIDVLQLLHALLFEHSLYDTRIHTNTGYRRAERSCNKMVRPHML